MCEHEKAGADRAVDLLALNKQLRAKIKRYKDAIEHAKYFIDGYGSARVRENLGREGIDSVLQGIDIILGCDKCGDPEIYKEWEGTKLCQICHEDLAAEAKSIGEEMADAFDEIIK